MAEAVSFEPNGRERRGMGPLPLLDDLLDRQQSGIQVGDGEERASAVARVTLRHLSSDVPDEDLASQASQRDDDRLVELRQRVIRVGLRPRARLGGLFDPQEDIAHELDRRRRQMQDQRPARGVVGHRLRIARHAGAREPW
jgi:hypothetical protein